MMKLLGLVHYLKAKFFRESPPSQTTNVPSSKTQRPIRTTSSPQNSNFVQIGFDFGTLFSKCVCRDVMTNKAWVHLVSESEGHNFPFLIPSTLLLRGGRLEHSTDPEYHYPENGLYHIKLALEKVALNRWDDPLLHFYRNAVEMQNNQLSEFVTSCAVYFLAGALGTVKQQVRRRLPNFGSNPKDYIAVNMAIPVADAERLEVNDLYYKVLCEAWHLADMLAGHPPIHISELENLVNGAQANRAASVDQACFIYPEVSANVQGFVRSRVSSTGMYLFSDAGAGSVDQSVFNFVRENQHERLIYLHGSVLPLGSSQIERQAAWSASRTDSHALEDLRIAKERGERDPALDRAKHWIAEQLSQGTETTLACAKKKLFVRNQLSQIRVIFGGGGHCKYPYETGVMRPFSGPLFPQNVRPDIVGLPIPSDLERLLRPEWLKRLTVAYGLSFIRDELAPFIYPQDIATPTPQDIWQPRAALGHAPSKDEC